jgi:hypothetical protein
VVPSSDVDIKGEAFQKVKVQQDEWRTVDHYTNPGPIQFFDEGQFDTNKTLESSISNYNDLLKKVRALCASVQRDCTFIDYEHLLVAAVSSLESARNVISSVQNAKYIG